MMEIIKKLNQFKEAYSDYRITRPKFTADEIRKAVSGEVSDFKGIEVFIRIITKYGKNNGSRSRSSAFGAEHEYYGLKDGKVVKTPFFAPDWRYFQKAQGVDFMPVLELEDLDELKKADEKEAKRLKQVKAAYRKRFPKRAKRYDERHGPDNWWVEGNAKTGYQVYINP